MFPERRRTIRRRLMQPATIVTDAGRTVPCLVRDVSAGGARIKVGADVELPDDFVLELDGSEPLTCHVLRKEPRHLAVAFH